MKYRHYAPRAEVVVITGGGEAVAARMNGEIRKKREEGLRCGALCFSETAPGITADLVLSYGPRADQDEQARRLFSALRQFDETDIDIIYAECPDRRAAGLAVLNRLLKAAGFHIMEA
jgi:L-threonylcarbamoyladenylate synthase